jgi:hypothetical protein
MSAQLRASYSLPKPVLGYHPGTFLERGAAVPFTTPALNGARARPGPRGALEFTVPNPSGGRGLYIVPWEGVFALCRPTVHDCRLISALSGLRGVTPTAIRAAARIIAAEGLAGRAARAAAQEAMVADERARTTVNFQLLLELVGQVEAQDATPAGPDGDLERRARNAVARIAPGLARTSEQIATSLEELAALFAPVGLGRTAAAARVPRLLAALEALRDAMLDWARAHPDETGADAARIAESAEVTLACARVVVAEVQAMPRAMVPLLRAWLAEPEAVAQKATRPDWLLDGWERIHLLWQTAEPALRDATLAEMATLIPVLPKEAAEWGHIDIPGITDGGLRRRMVAMAEDWRTGVTLHDLVVRNEHLLALAP